MKNYWNNNGTYQHMINFLDDRVPAEGRVQNPKKNPALERFRCASNAYYDLFNNGGGNRPDAVRKFFGNARFWINNGCVIERVYALTEPVMDEIVLNAYNEQMAKFNPAELAA